MNIVMGRGPKRRPHQCENASGRKTADLGPHPISSAVVSVGNVICFPQKKAYFSPSPLLFTTRCAIRGPYNSLRNSWALRDMLSLLEERTGWQWYRMQGTRLVIGAQASMKDVLLRLYVLSRPGTPEREQLVNEVLPAAFAADLYGALVEADPPQAWTKTANVVVFLDGFEALQHAASPTASRLLQGLTTEPRKHGRTDPLLLVLGSRDPVADVPEAKASLAFERTIAQDARTVHERMRELYTHWQQRMPAARRFLRLTDLYLPVWLRDFGKEDTQSYLLQFGEREQTRAFAEQTQLMQAIDELTHGHPLFLALAAETVLEAEARGRPVLPTEFERAKVSPEIAPEHEAEQIGDYLLELFLRQVSEAERKELIVCAIPRFLDVAVLHVLLPSLDDIDLQKRWQTYRRLSFMGAIDEGRSVIHPLVRRLLLQLLPVSADPASSYWRPHTQLRDHFKQRATSGEEQAAVEEAYHALALGDVDPAIQLGILAQQSRLPLWNPLLEAVRQAPTELLSPHIEEQADEALTRAEQHHKVEDSVMAIVHCTWLLGASHGTSEEVASLQLDLGDAYSSLPSGDREANVRQAIQCYEAALQVYTREAFPVDWATTQSTLGTAYGELPGGDQEANLRQAIRYFEAALQVRTPEAFPVEWAGIQNNLGVAYSTLPGGDQEANLRQAIRYFEAALQVYTHEIFPVEWARTQSNLGIAYRRLPAGDQEANVRQAIQCYEAALQVYTREAFPVDWATTQSNLGTAYWRLPAGDREANVRQAIRYFEAALQVFSFTNMDFYAEEVLRDLQAAQEDLQQLEPFEDIPRQN